jgi:predicted PurR-regulated permease PerM
MSEKNNDINKTKETETFPETGHFYLAQQINFLSQQISWQHDRINTIDSKFEQKIDALDKKFEQKIDALDKKFEQKIETLDKKIDDRFKWLLGITVASWITIIASVLASIFVR